MYRSLVVLTDPEIQQSLLNNGEALNTFPFLLAARQAAADYTGCPTCRKTEAKTKLENALKDVRRQIAIMPDASKAHLVRILNCQKFRVFYYDTVGNGATVRLWADYPPSK